jgi:hypothetical protein
MLMGAVRFGVERLHAQVLIYLYHKLRNYFHNSKLAGTDASKKEIYQ